MPATHQDDFPIIGVGASAGGLEACERFCKALPADSGMAFVLVQHLDPEHESSLAELLGRRAQVPVAQVEDGIRVEPDQIYVIPPKFELVLSEGQLRLLEPQGPRGLRMPIDRFLLSLAHERGERCGTIILSGMGSDGTRGLKAIHAAGGIVVAQDPDSAQFDGMPRSAIATGMADLILAPEEMPRALNGILGYLHDISEPSVDFEQEGLRAILAVLRNRAKHDFRGYKQATLKRRIQRRMGLKHAPDYTSYLHLLRSEPDEVQALYRDLLITVTSFFRDLEAWEVLAARVLPELVAGASAERPLRVWVAGCATGEEVYSLAMLLAEQLQRHRLDLDFQLFASDVERGSLEVARQALYPQSIAAEVSPERLRRFFNQEGEHYRVASSLRERVLFAQQNLLTDPPFSKLDLVCCRNLLIYLQSELQPRLIELFHFALKEGGYLFLGPSETIGSRRDLFQTISKRWHIYKKLLAARPPRPDLPLVGRRVVETGAPTAAKQSDLGEVTRQLLLRRFAPASVLLNRRYEGLYFFGRVSNYLEVPAGEPTSEVLSMARRGLRTKLRAAVHRAVHQLAEVSVEARVKRQTGYRPVRLSVVPVEVQDHSDHLFLLTFEELPQPEALARETPDDDPLVHQLEAELASTREDLQSTIEELETSNEELKTSNEEVMSVNEELQSTNEELESSKEELQSLNEELTTVNSQLEEKLDELGQVNSDIVNLLHSTNIATVFLDRQLRIMRFTPAVRQLLNLIATDLGRSLADISRRFHDEQLLDDAATVLETLAPNEKEVTSESGRFFLRRILPYRTVEDRIEGVVITFMDITELRTAQEQLVALHDRIGQQHKEQAELLTQLTERVPVCFSLLGPDRCFQWANRAHQKFGHPPAELLGMHLREFLGQGLYKQARDAVDRALAGEEAHCEIAGRPPGPEQEVCLRLSCFPRRLPDGAIDGIFLVLLDVSVEKGLRRQLYTNAERLAAILSSAPDGIVATDSNRVIQSINPALERMFGYAAEELLGCNLGILFENPAADLGGAFGPGLELRGRRRDGSLFPVFLTLSEVDHLEMFSGILRDLSQAKESEQRLRRSERLAGIGQAMASLVHESRNALARAQANLRRLSRRVQEQPELVALVEGAMVAGADLQRLFEEVRDYASPLQPAHKRQHLSGLVEQAWAALEPERQGREAHLSFRGGDPLCEVDGDLLQQAFRNLLENSLAVCSDPVRVEVSFSEGSLRGEAAVCVSLRDNGPGLDPEHRGRVLEPFFTTRAKGMGLGLAIVVRIVEAHGGKVSLGTEQGGAEILLLLPQRAG